MNHLTPPELEQRLFYKLLERWVKRTSSKVEMDNGCLCLLPNLKYDVVIKSSKLMRKDKS